MIYLASLYSRHAKGNSAKSRDLREKRFKYTMQRLSQLMQDGVVGVFSPIVHTHELANRYGLPKNYEFWKENDRHMIQKADAVYVLKMAIWEESEGITDELLYAEQLGKKIVYLDCPDYFEDTKEYVYD